MFKLKIHVICGLRRGIEQSKSIGIYFLYIDYMVGFTVY